MKVLIDTNVALDYMLNRSDYSSGSIPAVTPEEFIKIIAVV